MSSDFNILGIAGFLANKAAHALEIQTSKAKLADTAGPLADQRVRARSLSKPSHPDAGRLIAESSASIQDLYSTKGPADSFRRAIMLGASRA